MPPSLDTLDAPSPMTHEQLDHIAKKVDERFDNGRHDKCLLEGIFNLLLLTARNKVIEEQLIVDQGSQPTKPKKPRRRKS